MSETYFDEQAANRVCEFFERFLILPETGKPFMLAPWQRDMLRHTFGTKNADGSRLVRTLYVEIAKKNGKSSLAAGIALYMLAADGELSGEVYSVAGDRAQAAIIFESAKKMVKLSPSLAKIIKPYRYSLTHPNSSSAYHVLSAEAETKDGIKASAILFDEIHEQPDRRLWDVLRGSGLARRQPLTVVTTTAGHDRHSIGWEVHDYAVRVRDGKVSDPSFYPVIFAADEADPIDDPATWRKANPNLGVSVSEADFERLYKEAVAAGPARLNSWKRYHLNLWTQLATAWLPMSAWIECGKATVSKQSLLGRTAHAGADFSSTTDLTAVALLFPRIGAPGYELLVWHWMPRAKVIEAEQRDGMPYRAWADQRYLELTEGSAIDYETIKRRILEIKAQYPFYNDELAIDERNVWMLAQQLQLEDVEAIAISPKTGGMSAPSKELHRLIVEHQLCHGNNPLLDWQASIVEIKEYDGEIRPVKGAGVMRKRVDGIVATINAMSRAMVAAGMPPQEPSVYESRGVFVL